MNKNFSNTVEKLGIQGYQAEHFTYDNEIGQISNIISKFREHPSIIKLREVLNNDLCFTFTPINEDIMQTKIKSLDKKKATTFKGIPSKILAENYDVISPFVANMYNESTIKMEFPDLLKLADITPIHKKDDTTNKENYRPVSILPPVSKLFERTCLIKFLLILTVFYPPIYVVSVKATVHSLVS